MRGNCNGYRTPALGLTEAAMLPAESQEAVNHFVPVTNACATPVAEQPCRGSGAGRSVLSARGIQLPGAAPMRSMNGTKARSATDGCPIYPAAWLIRNDPC